MRMAKVVGKLSLSRCVAEVTGKRWLVTIPITLPALAGRKPIAGEELVVLDELGADEGSVIAVSEGGEAVTPFLPDNVPIDAYASLLLDHWEIRESEVADLLGKET